MKKAFITEFVWLIGVLVLTLVIQYFMLPKITKDGVLDINLHDTYLVINTKTIMLLSFVAMGFLVNLVRSLVSLFKGLSINMVSVVFTVLVILSLPFTLEYAMALTGQGNGWTIYPPLSVAQGVEQPIAEHFFNLFKVFTLVKNVLVVYLCFISIRVGMGIKKNWGK